jgi:hypothetical protein
MDWSVILDGFVLLMQVGCGLFLAWGGWFALQSPEGTGSERPRAPVPARPSCVDVAEERR